MSTRAENFQALRETLQEMRGRAGISEIAFRDAWLSKLRANPKLFADGWYAPPPHGMAVLFASSADPQRICYSSLRDKCSWAGTTEADWSGFMFAYSSCVGRDTGKLGDMDVTLYFGDDTRLKSHYRNCFAATNHLLDTVQPDDTSQKIFQRSEEVFAKAGLKNCVVSFTDTSPLDIGHHFPVLPKGMLQQQPQQLTDEHRQYISKARKFINGTSDWTIDEGMQFTIEPQLRSVHDSELPQISFHYLLEKIDGRLVVCRDINELIEPLL